MNTDYEADPAIRSLLRYFKVMEKRTKAATKLGFVKVIIWAENVDEVRMIVSEIEKMPKTRGHRIVNGGDMNTYNGTNHRPKMNLFFENADDALLFKLKYNGDLV
jgi:hypothetical protein